MRLRGRASRRMERTPSPFEARAPSAIAHRWCLQRDVHLHNQKKARL